MPGRVYPGAPPREELDAARGASALFAAPPHDLRRVAVEVPERVLPAVQDQRVHQLGALAAPLLVELRAQQVERAVHLGPEQRLEVGRRDPASALVEAAVLAQRRRGERRD